MIENTLNLQYPSLQTLTSIIVQVAVKAMLDDGYKGQTEEHAELNDYVEVSFCLYEWEPDSENVRLQVMRELEFIGFAW